MKATKILALLMALALLIGTLAACTSTPAEPANTPAAATPAPAANNSSNQSTPAPTEEPEPEETPFPLTGSLICEPGTRTLTVWLPRMEETCQLLNDFNENPTAVEAEKLTGVHIDWTLVTQGSANDLYSLMIASDDLTDIVAHHNTATLTFGLGKGADSVVEDGYFLRLNELIDQYAPNFKKLINSDKNKYLKEITTDSGNIPAFYWLEKEGYSWAGLGYRIDVLEQIGKENEVPTTISGWESIFDELMGSGMYEHPFCLSQYGYFVNAKLFSSAYGVAFDFYQVDGKVKYGPAEEGYREYLRTMRRWHDKGYFNPEDVFENNGFNALVNDLSMCYESAAVGLGTAWGESGFASNPNFNMGAAPSPKVNDSDSLHLDFTATCIGPAIAISSNCSDQELATKWLDFWYSDEGSFLANYGIEGKTFEYVNGEPRYTEFVTANPDNLSLDQTLQTYCFANIAGLCYTDAKFIAEPFRLVGETIWSTYSDGAWNMPAGMSRTADEGSRFSAIFTDLETYVKEYSAKFIAGSLNLDTDWDAFVAKFADMHLQEAIDIEQAAYDRYIARG